MEREFNVTGSCNAKKHYVVDISSKLEQVMRMIRKGKYFTINRPRQYGKTTMLGTISRELRKQKDHYVLCRLSFEGIGDSIFADEHIFPLNSRHY